MDALALSQCRGFKSKRNNIILPNVKAIGRITQAKLTYPSELYTRTFSRLQLTSEKSDSLGQD